MNYLINVHNFNFDCLKLLGGHRKARTFCKNKLGIGKYLVDGIYNKIKENKNLKIYLNSKVIELLLIDNEIKGVKFE
jgi:succinate dehydrogenase/fumarate reductase flavoprotein subunit